MIATTYNCGCPILKKPSLIAETVGLQSSCCFPSGLPYQSHTVQYRQSRTVEKLEHITSRDKVSCCINCKNSRYAPLYPEVSSERPISATTTYLPKDSESKQFSRSGSESRLKKKLEMSTMKQPSTGKIVSEIVRKGQPFKEIEAIINNNRVIIRMQKEPVKEEYDPPCDCVGQADVKESTSSLKKCADGVAFDMTNGSLELSRTSPEDASSMEKVCDREESGCRTVMLYPNVKDGDDTGQIFATSRLESERTRRLKRKRLLDLEENPNIFVLRIRKLCESGDKKHKIDLEFRAPRPWRAKKEKKERLADLSEKLKEVEESIADEQSDIYTIQ